jgi:hypothetical protein
MKRNGWRFGHLSWHNTWGSGGRDCYNPLSLSNCIFPRNERLCTHWPTLTLILHHIILDFIVHMPGKGHLTINKEICINTDECFGADLFHIDSHTHIWRCRDDNLRWMHVTLLQSNRFLSGTTDKILQFITGTLTMGQKYYLYMTNQNTIIFPGCSRRNHCLQLLL